LAAVPLRSLASRDVTYFELLAESGGNIVRAAQLLERMFETWPEEGELAREILKAEQEGDRITQEIVRRLNVEPPKGVGSADLYSLATQLDDIVDDIEEAADFMGLYKIEAPMEQAHALAEILAQSCVQVSALLTNLRDFNDLEAYWVEIHRLENEGDRVWREALASLFSNGIDPMVVIRWKDIFGLLERAIDSTETAAHTIEAIAVKHS
jgi:predicted phosphate transport protein (TIGR00153 family)